MAVSIAPYELRAVYETDLSDRSIQGVIAAAKAVVERYAPAAPEAVQNEACLRFAAYLLDTGGNPAATGVKASPDLEATLSPSGHAAAFQRSGAAALLTRFKVRRLGGAA